MKTRQQSLHDEGGQSRAGEEGDAQKLDDVRVAYSAHESALSHELRRSLGQLVRRAVVSFLQEGCGVVAFYHHQCLRVQTATIVRSYYVYRQVKMMTYIRTNVTTNMPNDIIHNLEDTTSPLPLSVIQNLKSDTESKTYFQVP